MLTSSSVHIAYGVWALKYHTKEVTFQTISVLGLWREIMGAFIVKSCQDVLGEITHK